jgi:hypothetical protein
MVKATTIFPLVIVRDHAHFMRYDRSSEMLVENGAEGSDAAHMAGKDVRMKSCPEV